MWAEQLKAIENISWLWKRSVWLRTDHNILAFVPHNWVTLALDLKSKWMLEVKKFEWECKHWSVGDQWLKHAGKPGSSLVKRQTSI